jgi:hypothetical protein
VLGTQTSLLLDYTIGEFDGDVSLSATLQGGIWNNTFAFSNMSIYLTSIVSNLIETIA